MSRTSLFLLGVALATPALLPAAPVPEAKPDDRELHIVGLNEGMTGNGKAAVRVDRPGKIVTLVLGAYGPVAWDVTVIPQTRLTKVILGGYHKQSVSGLPRGAEVVEAFAEGHIEETNLPAAYEVNSAKFRAVVRHVHWLTGQEVASFQGAYRPEPDRPFVVDRVQTDPRLRSDYPRPAPAADLPKLEFGALEVLDTAGRTRVSYGTFTLTGGPKDGTLVPLPQGVIHLAVDPATRRAYGLTWRGVVEVDLARGRAVPVPEPWLGLSSLRDIAYDTKRGRVLVAADRLWAYDPAGGRWALLAHQGWRRPLALAYHPVDDALYGLMDAVDEGKPGAPVLVRYGPKGEVVSRTELGEPMFHGMFGRWVAGSHVQLLVADGRLVAVVTTGLHRVREWAPVSFVFLIDPKTGGVKLGWRYPER
jgi:hypothetical protein